MNLELVPTLVIVAAVAIVGLLAKLATDTNGSWYQGLIRPSWQPPRWLFGPAWLTIYALFATSATLAWHATWGRQRVTTMLLFGLNAALNVAWGFIFFRSRSPYVAAVDLSLLTLSVLWIMVRVVPFSAWSAVLLLPYLLWVAYASVVNWSIARRN